MMRICKMNKEWRDGTWAVESLKNETWGVIIIISCRIVFLILSWSLANLFCIVAPLGNGSIN
jgi:hypothetical protein